MLALLDQFKDVFAASITDFGLDKGFIHQINTGNAPSFRTKPYRCSQVEEAQVSKELNKPLDSGLLAPS